MIYTVKLVYPTLLKQYAIYSDMVTEDKQYKLTDPGKRLLGGIADKAYMDTSIEDVLRQSVPTDKLPQLLKKVRGKVYATDVKNIKAILECSDEDADAIAYMVAEAATWSEFDALCRAHKISDGERAELIDTISNAVVVIRSPKIKAERMESK